MVSLGLGIWPNLCWATFTKYGVWHSTWARQAPSGELAEGSHTVASLAHLASLHKIDVPITNAVDKLVNQGEDLHQIVAGLLASCKYRMMHIQINDR